MTESVTEAIANVGCAGVVTEVIAYSGHAGVMTGVIANSGQTLWNGISRTVSLVQWQMMRTQRQQHRCKHAAVKLQFANVSFHARTAGV